MGPLTSTHFHYTGTNRRASCPSFDLPRCSVFGIGHKIEELLEPDRFKTTHGGSLCHINLRHLLHQNTFKTTSTAKNTVSNQDALSQCCSHCGVMRMTTFQPNEDTDDGTTLMYMET